MLLAFTQILPSNVILLYVKPVRYWLILNVEELFHFTAESRWLGFKINTSIGFCILMLVYTGLKSVQFCIPKDLLHLLFKHNVFLIWYEFIRFLIRIIFIAIICWKLLWPIKYGLLIYLAFVCSMLLVNYFMLPNLPF